MMSRFFLQSGAVSVLVLVCLGMISGCASVPAEQAHPSDPLESFNRGSDRLNRDFDEAIGKPVAKGYRRVLPDPFDRGFTNFFENLTDVNSAANNLLQAKPKQAASDVGRFCVNTTIGLLGFFDVASDMGLQRYREDFGQTLGHWGYEESAYFVIPILGPSTVRDAAGRVVDLFINPLYFTQEGLRWSLLVVKLIDIRADLLETVEAVDEAALDRYVFVRESYLQKRRYDIFDGDPPLEDDLFDEFFDEDLNQTP